MNNTILASQGMMQRSSMGSWMSSWLGVSWMRSRGELYRDVKSCAERGERHTQAPYLRLEFSDVGERFLQGCSKDLLQEKSEAGVRDDRSSQKDVHTDYV